MGIVNSWDLALRATSLPLRGGLMYEHRMDAGGPKAWKSTDAESRPHSQPGRVQRDEPLQPVYAVL